MKRILSGLVLVMAVTTGACASTAPIARAGASGPADAFWVYHNGRFGWAGDLSYSGLVVDYRSRTGAAPGAHVISCTGNAGGWQPYAPRNDFDLTPYAYLTVALKPTIPGEEWISAFESNGDVPVGVTVDLAKYGPAPVVGQWATYKIPLGKDGYQIPAGTHIYKFMIQAQVVSTTGTNVWYVDKVAFTAD